jgi:hypothetical protein
LQILHPNDIQSLPSGLCVFVAGVINYRFQDKLATQLALRDSRPPEFQIRLQGQLGWGYAALG